MTRHQNEGICAAPEFTPHRVAVKAADSGSGYKFGSGIDCHGWANIVADVMLAGTNTTVEAKYWSDLVGDYVSTSPATTWTLTGNAQLTVPSGGRRTFLQCTGSFTQVDIEVAGLAPRQHPDLD